MAQQVTGLAIQTDADRGSQDPVGDRLAQAVPQFWVSLRPIGSPDERSEIQGRRLC